ncbi:MAG: hypothetical protein LBM08_00820 [Dysgonamonadaceae bacterium]|jgi:hypothetical protein|nr:hypothetical protein [Dysgonamonadaceae bacterium]
MSKSEHQVIKFLDQHNFKSEMDRKMILWFCENDLNLDYEKPSKFSCKGIDTAIFKEWFENGFGSGDIVRLDGKLAIIGVCNTEKARVEATLEGETLNRKRYEVRVSELSKATGKESSRFRYMLGLYDLQFSEQFQLIVRKNLPSAKDRVSFRSAGVRGVGVIRSVSKEEDRFELFCYHIQQTGELKYSMHEEISPMSEYTFDVMTVNERRRFETRLRKEGKSWNDKLHRIEPVEAMAPEGSEYWYITDKMKLASDRENGKFTSRERYRCGNYFITRNDGQENLARITEQLRDFLAR